MRKKNGWRQITFYLERAKRIQDKKEPGRIVNCMGNTVILSENESNGYKCYIHEEPDGVHVSYGDESVLNMLNLSLEIPIEEEETSKLPDITTQEGFSKAFSKQEFKVGDLVHIRESENVFKIIKIENGDAILKDIKNTLIGKYVVPVHSLTLHKQEHVFKPFDKVLVRDNDEDKWVPDIFRYYDDNYPKDYPYRCCANDYKQCILYEGNEHLVGTTNNPE